MLKIVYYLSLIHILNENGIYLAAQCCEHLNRALVVERAAAEKYMLDEVCVRPMPKAGGSFATAVYDRMSDPVMVEHVKAHAGMDIGCTLIGMHLKDVAVPLRLSCKKIGDALVTAAYTRPKLIGGVRAVSYTHLYPSRKRRFRRGRRHNAAHRRLYC